MERLNTARVGLKHHGNFLDLSTIESHRAAVSAFFEECTPEVFGVEFDRISLLDLIAFEETKAALAIAEDNADSGNWEAALGDLRVAFDRLLKEYRKSVNWPGFAGWADILVPVPSGTHEIELDLADLAQEVSNEIGRLEEAIFLVSIGIELRRWQRFLLLTPRVDVSKDGAQKRFPLARVARESGRTEYDYCKEFVVESALGLQRQRL